MRSQLWNADVFLLLQIVGYIQRKDWDRARTALRLYTYETRKAMTRFTNASNDSVSSKPHAHCVSPTLPPALPRLSFRSECDLHSQFFSKRRAGIGPSENDVNGAGLLVPLSRSV